jgi:hypothetical protein
MVLASSSWLEVISCWWADQALLCLALQASAFRLITAGGMNTLFPRRSFEVPASMDLRTSVR